MKTKEEIYNRWKEQSLKFGISYSASWSDKYAIDLEIKTILNYLQNNDNVLDVGCANGYSTYNYASNKKIIIKGIDYIPEMIKQAKLRVRNNLSFCVGDILNLDEPTNYYDKVIITRVIINLHDIESQLKALCNAIKVIKPGGLLLLSEATIQGREKLNKMRKEWNLSEIPMPEFNLYIDEEQIINYISNNMEFIEVNNFSSSYFVGTRIIKALLNQSLGDKNIDVSNPNMEFNRWCSMLPSVGDYGTQKLFVFRKFL